MPNRIINSIYYFAKAKNIENWISANLPIMDEDSLFYCYWFNHAVLALCMIKRKNTLLKIASRAHGYDLYEERNKNNWMPFRRVIDGLLNRVFFISENGKKYYTERYHDKNRPVFKPERYVLSRIGTGKKDDIDKSTKNPVFLLVSCSRIESVKRLERIIYALEGIPEERIHWVHIGDGELKNDMEALAKDRLDVKENISYEFKGYLKSEAVFSFYTENRPDCFILTSESEGSPVAMQEACAFGIPVIGTDVGGVRETLDGNGILLKNEPEIAEITAAILGMYHMENSEYSEMAARSKEIWKESFNLDENMEAFCREVTRVFEQK